jgi:hypothetical protein
MCPYLLTDFFDLQTANYPTETVQCLHCWLSPSPAVQPFSLYKVSIFLGWVLMKEMNM